MIFSCVVFRDKSVNRGYLFLCWRFQRHQSSLMAGLRATNEMFSMQDHHATDDKSKESSLDRDSEPEHKVSFCRLLSKRAGSWRFHLYRTRAFATEARRLSTCLGRTASAAEAAASIWRPLFLILPCELKRTANGRRSVTQDRSVSLTDYKSVLLALWVLFYLR